jgi:hypothetical protein
MATAKVFGLAKDSAPCGDAGAYCTLRAGLGRHSLLMLRKRKKNKILRGPLLGSWQRPRGQVYLDSIASPSTSAGWDCSLRGHAPPAVAQPARRSSSSSFNLRVKSKK